MASSSRGGVPTRCPVPGCHVTCRKENDIPRHLKEQHQAKKICPREGCGQTDRRISRLIERCQKEHPSKPLTRDEVNALEDIQDYWYQKLRRTHGLDGTEPQPPESTEDFNDIRTRQPGYPNEFSHSMESHDAVKYQNEQGWDAELEDEQLHEDSFFSSYEETPGLSTRDGDGLGNGYYRQQHQYRQEPYSQSDYHQGYSDPQPSQTAYESELNGSDLSHHYPFSVTPAGSNSPENDQQDEPVISNITLSPENEAVVSYDDGFSDSVPEFYNSYPYWQQSQSTPNFYDRLDLQPNES